MQTLTDQTPAEPHPRSVLPPPPPPTPTAPGTDSPDPDESTTGWRSRLLLLALTVSLSLVAGALGARLFAPDAVESNNLAVGTDQVSVALGSETMDVAAVLDRLQSSVVSIDTVVQTRRGPFVAEGEGAGTGVVIDETNGYILTNAHVVEGAEAVSVTLAGDDATRTATIVATDTTADVAVIQVSDTTGLVAADVAAADTTQVGDEVIAIGNALALEGDLTVTQGIVSAVDRSIDTETGTITGLIQTDAAISSGNSGGPLVNAAGQVVGINTAVAASTGTVQASNVGFAISIDQALRVADSLLA